MYLQCIIHFFNVHFEMTSIMKVTYLSCMVLFFCCCWWELRYALAAGTLVTLANLLPCMKHSGTDKWWLLLCFLNAVSFQWNEAPEHTRTSSLWPLSRSIFAFQTPHTNISRAVTQSSAAWKVAQLPGTLRHTFWSKVRQRCLEQNFLNLRFYKIYQWDKILPFKSQKKVQIIWFLHLKTCSKEKPSWGNSCIAVSNVSGANTLS